MESAELLQRLSKGMCIRFCEQCWHVTGARHTSAITEVNIGGDGQAAPLLGRVGDILYHQHSLPCVGRVALCLCSRDKSCEGSGKLACPHISHVPSEWVCLRDPQRRVNHDKLGKCNLSPAPRCASRQLLLHLRKTFMGNVVLKALEEFVSGDLFSYRTQAQSPGQETHLFTAPGGPRGHTAPPSRGTSAHQGPRSQPSAPGNPAPCPS